MSFFPKLDKLEDDPIMKIPVEFKADPREEKANLGVGAYRDAAGLPWILPSIKEAENQLIREEVNKDYLPIQGNLEFCDAIPKHIFGASHPLIVSKRLATLQTIGGSGALRIIGDFLTAYKPDSTLYLSSPTWPNHIGIFSSAKASLSTYPYFDRETNKYLHKELLQAINQAPEQSIFLFHGCCHNPTGVDPDKKEWEEIFNACKDRKHFVIMDVAYQGLGSGMEEDATSMRIAGDLLPEFAICYSCSKNMGLYGERLGHLTVVFEDETQAINGLTHLKKIVRGSYSSAPLHGSRIAVKLLTDERLNKKWLKEVETMRARIVSMRSMLNKSLDNISLSTGNGMFTLLPLSPEHVTRLKSENGIYMPSSGRINVAGLTEHNLTLVANALNSL